LCRHFVCGLPQERLHSAVSCSRGRLQRQAMDRVFRRVFSIFVAPSRFHQRQTVGRLPALGMRKIGKICRLLRLVDFLLAMVVGRTTIST
jgi:hypothetical protein